MMKKRFFSLLITFCFFSAYAQDSIPVQLVRPYIENGIDFIRSETLKQNYNTNSKYFYGFGIQIGHPSVSKIIPYAQISLSKFGLQSNLFLVYNEEQR